ncbi:MAG: hypothetical protein LBQ70_05235 [Prevotellaceae bacterium]|jgi:hypothetical protein|nr:hypothetical protein [Prevotellaceae bacterium]
MRNLIGLMALFSITVSNTYAQIKAEQIELDTVFDEGYIYFELRSKTISPDNNNRAIGNFDNNAMIINSIEAERKRAEEERKFIEYIDSMRVVSFNKVLELTDAQAAVFWPVYKDYSDKIEKVQNKRRDVSTKLCDPFKKYRRNEYEALVNMDVKSYEDEALLRKQYAEKFKDILGEKSYLLYRAEYLFRRWIYRSY